MQTTATPLSANERRQADELRRARRRATGLLAAVAVGFLASFGLPDGAATGYLRAALEAGLVGGLADWFAVVALFRHPLGLPIPHTAVIPRSKDGLGANLAGFVRDNFLGAEEVRDRIADPAHVERLGRWLVVPANAERVAVHAAELAVAALDVLDDDELLDRLTAAARRRLHAVPVARLAGVSLEQTISEGRHQVLVAAAIDGILDAMEAHRSTLRRRLGQQAPTWVPTVVNDLVFDRAEEVARSFLRQVAADPEHELRRALDEQLLGVSSRLQGATPLATRLDEAAHQAITDAQLRAWVAGWWDELQLRLRQTADPVAGDTPLRRALVTTITDTGARLVAGGELHDRLLAVLRSVAPRVAASGQTEVGSLITATIDRWDAEDTSRRLELWMGSDLQFVRINGTVVGAVVGIVLHAVAQLLA